MTFYLDDGSLLENSKQNLEKIVKVYPKKVKEFSIKRHNSGQENLTPEKLQSWQEFSRLSEDDANEIVNSIIVLADIIVEIILNEQDFHNEAEPLSIEQKSKKLAA